MKTAPSITALAARASEFVAAHQLATPPKLDHNGIRPIALTLRQPWAEMILKREHGAHWKDLENRGRAYPNMTGWFYIHAGQGMTEEEYLSAIQFAGRALPAGSLSGFPRPSDLQRGGIVGAMHISHWITPETAPAEWEKRGAPNPWYMGKAAAVITAVRRLPFHPCRGMQGWFPVSVPKLKTVDEPAQSGQ